MDITERKVTTIEEAQAAMGAMFIRHFMFDLMYNKEKSQLLEEVLSGNIIMKKIAEEYKFLTEIQSKYIIKAD